MDFFFTLVVFAPAFLVLFLGLALLTSESLYIRACSILVPTGLVGLMAYILIDSQGQNELYDVMKMQVCMTSIAIMILLFVEFVIRPIWAVLACVANQLRRALA